MLLAAPAAGLVSVPSARTSCMNVRAIRRGRAVQLTTYNVKFPQATCACPRGIDGCKKVSTLRAPATLRPWSL